MGFFQLFSVARLLAEINEKVECIMSAIDDLKAEVTKVNTVEASAVTLIRGIAAQIAAAVAAGDHDALTALTTQLTTGTDALAAAVTANTPVATPTADTPTPTPNPAPTPKA